MGVASMESEYMNLDIQTLDNGYMRIAADAAFRTNMPLEISYDDAGYVDDVQFDSFSNQLVSTKNSGFGFDIGATYQLTDKLLLGAAINDIGYIKWKDETSRFYTNGVFEYTGIDVSEELTGDAGDQEYLEDIVDDFEDTFRFSDEGGSYTTGLMGSFNVSADYQFKHWLNFGFVSKNYWVDKKLVPQITLATGLQAGRTLSGVLSYSYMKNAPANLGAGMAFNLGAFQLYAVTDNLTSMFKPSTAKYVNARLGINFVFNGKIEEGID